MLMLSPMGVVPLSSSSDLEAALGSGRGMRSAKVRRSHVSKYEKKERVIDPWTETVMRANASTRPISKGLENAWQAGRSLASQLPKRSFSFDVEGFDGRDPTTFGFEFCGTIVGAHGLRGDLRVDGVNLMEPGLRHLRLVSRVSPRPVVLESGRRLKVLGATERYVVRLEGLRDRETAASLAGATLFARRREEDRDRNYREFELEDEPDELFGAHVFDVDSGDRIATVFDVLEQNNLAHDLVELKISKDRHCYVPLARPIFHDFDPELRHLFLKVPPGLLDLDFEYREPPPVIKGLLSPPTAQEEDVS